MISAGLRECLYAGVTQRFVWDLDADYIQRSTEYGFNRPEKEENGFYFQNEHGSPVRIADTKGNTREVNGYDEFGNSVLKKGNGIKFLVMRVIKSIHFNMDLLKSRQYLWQYMQKLP